MATAAPVARAITLTPGDIIIGANIGASTTSADWGLLEIDPATGNRTIIADNTTGTGPAMQAPTAISFAPDGSLLVTYDNMVGANDSLLYRVDPATGNRTILSAQATSSGPVSTYVKAVESGGTILVSGGPIVSVDPTTGSRTLVAGAGLGTGPAMASYGFAISGPNLYVGNASGGTIGGPPAILNVDVTTGNRTVVSSATIGTGPALAAAADIAIDAAGQLIVDNAVPISVLPTLLSVDPATGNRTLLSGGGVGTGPDLGVFPAQVGIAAGGTIYINSLTYSLSQSPVLAVDPLTGNRTIVADGTHGIGPLFDPGLALAIVPTPEPASFAMAAIAGLVLVAQRALRKRR